jgi:hypothetical protein
MFSIDFRLTDFEGVLQQRVRIDDFKVELHLAAIDTRQIQQVVDESRFQFHVTTNHLQRFANVRADVRLILQLESRSKHGVRGVRNS